MQESRHKMQTDLTHVYGQEVASQIWPQFAALLDQFHRQHPEFAQRAAPPNRRLSERDVVLITYGDQIQAPGEQWPHPVGSS